MSKFKARKIAAGSRSDAIVEEDYTTKVADFDEEVVFEVKEARVEERHSKLPPIVVVQINHRGKEN